MIYDQLKFLWKFAAFLSSVWIEKIPKIFLLAPLLSMLQPFLDFR